MILGYRGVTLLFSHPLELPADLLRRAVAMPHPAAVTCQVADSQRAAMQSRRCTPRHFASAVTLSVGLSTTQKPCRSMLLHAAACRNSCRARRGAGSRLGPAVRRNCSCGSLARRRRQNKNYLDMTPKRLCRALYYSLTETESTRAGMITIAPTHRYC
jgi:hypothetical protein